jgi:two-component system alkaline phosphatase synthesis response regulator PhoP
MAKRVLIADDSVNTRGILRFMLQNQGFELVEAEDGEDALAKAGSSSPDLIILDGMMPKKSGFEACQELKQNPKTSSIPVILLTAVAQVDPTHDWAKDTPADRFMAKPFQLRDLLAAIESLTGTPLASETALRRKDTLDPRPQGTVLRPKNTAR